MEKKVYEEMFNNEETHWWFVGTRNIVLSLINKYIKNKNNLMILDIGCGTGIVIKKLNKYGTVYGIDKSNEAVDFCRKRGIENIIEANATDLPFNDNTFDLILYLDVLEHIKDENEAISEMYRVLKTNGLAVVTVPAFNFLWSDHDMVLNHFRRYRIRHIKRIFLNNSFSILKASYFNTILFPIIAIIRIGKKLIKRFRKSDIKETDISNLPKIINAGLLSFLNAEKIILKKFTFPFGVSIFLILQKN